MMVYNILHTARSRPGADNGTSSGSNNENTGSNNGNTGGNDLNILTVALFPELLPCQ